MQSAPAHSKEALRIQGLESLNVLDTAAEAQLDNITRVAATLCDAPIALISLVDEHRQWFKSMVGLPPQVTETSRETAFCAHAILENGIMEVENASEDERFYDNPMVTGDPKIRFYAGQPLIVGGMPIGTLCVIDSIPRQLSASQRVALEHLGGLAQSLLEDRKKQAQSNSKQRDIDEELDLAREVLQSITNCGKSSTELRHAVLPATRFSGDLVASASSPSGQFFGLFADVSGHGLAAALYQIPAVDGFKAQVALDRPVGEVARAINARLKSLARTSHFMAAIVFCHDRAAQRLTVWNGGMPDAWLLNEAGEVSGGISSSHVALGILPDAAFDATHVTIEQTGDLELVMLSDGVLECMNDGQQEFGRNRAQAVLHTAPRNARMETLLASVFAHQGDALQHDDMAVAVLDLAAA
jgi:serine phosphatase RsbU (regulator of sigma subunit)